ncbi:unnamed protein product [Lota lota]
MGAKDESPRGPALSGGDDAETWHLPSSGVQRSTVCLALRDNMNHAALEFHIGYNMYHAALEFHIRDNMNHAALERVTHPLFSPVPSKWETQGKSHAEWGDIPLQPQPIRCGLADQCRGPGSQRADLLEATSPHVKQSLISSMTQDEIQKANIDLVPLREVKWWACPLPAAPFSLLLGPVGYLGSPG